jgi:hypothetical protein
MRISNSGQVSKVLTDIQHNVGRLSGNDDDQIDRSRSEVSFSRPPEFCWLDSLVPRLVRRRRPGWNFSSAIKFWTSY